MADPDYHVHDETITTEVALVIHVQGPVSTYDLGVAAEKLRTLLRWDSIERQGREASTIFATAMVLQRFDVSEVCATPDRSSAEVSARADGCATSPRETSRAPQRESSTLPS